MDVLSDAIAAMRTGLPHAARVEKHAPWGARFLSAGRAGFHAMLRGSGWLVPADEAAAPVRIGPGDVVFLAHRGGHALVSEVGAPVEEIAMRPDGTWPVAPPPPPGSGAPDAVTLCGAYLLDESRSHPLLAELPDVVHLPASEPAHQPVRAALELLGAELEHPSAGSDTIVTSLLDTLLLYILRAWWLTERHGSGHPTGWAAALADPAVTAALRAMHGDPGHPWTVEELGAVAGLSRAAFARRFTATVGSPPLAYLTWWRMTTAGRLLREDSAPLREVAQRTGYATEFAFAKAFKREYGVAPGRYRRAGAAAG